MKTERKTRSSSVLIAFATLVGTSIEAYDFYIFGFAAAFTFPALFFPKSDPFFGQLASYAIFWAGFLARPLGGVVFGHFGDKLGRRSMLVTSLTTMGIATFAVGLLPTYDRIGLWAPLLLVALRLCQGVAVGGEWGGAVIMAAEHAQARFKGVLTSFPQMGAPLGLILASVVFAVVSRPYSGSGIGGAGLAGIAWRVPFLLSIVLVAVGLAVRVSLAETPVFERMKARAAIAKAPVASVLRRSWKTVVLSGGSFLAISGGFYLVTTATLSYGAGPHSILKLDPRVFFTANLAGSAIGLVATPLGAWLSDRIGRRPVFMTSVALILILAFPIYAMIDSKNAALIGLAVCLFCLPASAAYGALAAMFSELFDANVRYSGVSLGYHAAAVLGGGLAPLVSTFLLKASGGASWVLALYLAAMGAISLISISLIAETRQVDLSDLPRVPAPPISPAGFARFG